MAKIKEKKIAYGDHGELVNCLVAWWGGDDGSLSADDDIVDALPEDVLERILNCADVEDCMEINMDVEKPVTVDPSGMHGAAYTYHLVIKH